ncbi:MAG: insulinase family protein, partial [Bacilli bacterium]|nr:insulinase family protein [Bacilli bacterium]
MIKKFSDRLKETRLSNGLHVMVYEIKDRPSFKMDLLVHFGAFYEKYKIDGEIKELKTGLAHFIEHVKFEMPDGDIIPSFEKEGLEVNAYTSFKMTDFYCGGTRNFYRGLELLFKLVFTPCFKEESIEKEREIIQSERLEKDMKKKELSDTFTNNLFISYPYKHEIVGSLEDILSISKEDLEEAYKLFYYPENMDLVITGDVNFEEIIAFLEKEILKYQFNENKNPSLYIEKESLS